MGEARGTRRGWLRLLLPAVAVVATGAVHASMDTSTQAASGRLRVPDPRVARVASLGFEPLLADWYWIQALQLVGGELHDGEDPAAAWGSLAVYDEAGRLIPNAAERYAYNSATAMRSPGGRFAITLARSARPGN